MSEEILFNCEGTDGGIATRDLFAFVPDELHFEIIKHLTFHGLFWARGINRFYLTVCLREIRSEYLKYIDPQTAPHKCTRFCTSWMQLQRPQCKDDENVYRWKRNSTNQRPDRFASLCFYLYPILSDEFEILNNRFRLGEDEPGYLPPPSLSVIRKAETVYQEHPFACFAAWGDLSWSGILNQGIPSFCKTRRSYPGAGVPPANVLDGK